MQIVAYNVRDFFARCSDFAAITKGKMCLMSHPTKPDSTISRKRALVAAGVILMNVALVILALVFISAPRSAAAQEDKPDATPVPGGVRFDNYPHPQSRGALAYTLGDRWDHTDLTYYYQNCPRNINCNTAHQAVDAAFQSWAEVSTLTFQEVGSARQADIELLWTVDSPELGYIGDVLAFTTFPSDGGDVYFDDAEPWSAFDGGSFDLYLVAAHELGHAFGLDHSSVPTALMYPVLTPNTTGLTDDDAAGIQALYGRPEARQEEIPQETDLEDVLVSGEIDDQYPFEEWEFEAFAGETLTITMTATSGDLDPYLGLLTYDEETILAESGPSNGDVAQIVYSFDQDDTYVVVATRDGADEGDTSGTYDLTLTSGDQSQPSGGGGGTVDDQGNDDVVYADIWSYTVMDICEAYISPTTDDEWGTNLLDGTLTNGNVLENEVPPGMYDILVVGCDGTEIEEYGVDISDDSAIEVYDGEINVYVYAD
jgi:hypothetical protein